MTLNRQLWLAIILMLFLAFCGTFAVSTLAAKSYLEQQLRVKNLDNATSLALSISQMPKDMVTIELLLAAQFDAGHYRLIRLTGPEGEVLVERTSLVEDSDAGAPEWFIRAFPIEVPPGIAQIQDGWQQFGTLRLESHDRFAYSALWRGTQQLLLWFLGVAVLAGFLGTVLLRVILKPLSRVVDQAEAIGARQFVTTPEPGTLEFKRVVRAMNTLSNRVRDMLGREAARVERLMQEAQQDPVTGLFKREAFMARLDSLLSQDSKHGTGVLVLLRLDMLQELNRKIGHVATDQMLQRVGKRLSDLASMRTVLWTTGRTSGTDVALLAPGETDIEATAAKFQAEVLRAMEQPDISEADLPVGATAFTPGEKRAAILTRTDAALAASQETGQIVVKRVDAEADSGMPTDLTGWRALLEPALTPQHLSLVHFPVITRSGELLQLESPVRLNIRGQEMAAGQFISWVARLGWITRLDTLVLEAGLGQVDITGDDVAINLSIESICDSAFIDQLVKLVTRRPEAASQLWLDVPEHGALHHLPEFRTFCQAVKPLRCKLGLKHAGPGFARIDELHDLGLNHLKLEASLSRGIESNSGNQSFVRGICTVVHSVGMLAIAEGVNSDAERMCLESLGVDAVTGPAIKR